MRGNHDNTHQRSKPYRSIPTCAGQPTPRHAPEALAQVYPHVCGATRMSPMNACTTFGLSPRVRGSLDCMRSQRLVYAEVYPHVCGAADVIAIFDRQAPSLGVYPHVCGAAESEQPQPSGQMTGLSPRVRGSLVVAQLRVLRLSRRSIPTCAGQAFSSCRWRPARHGGLSPRVRGSHINRGML